MLRIERKSRDLYVRLRETKTRLLSRPFNIALAVALALHLAAVILFRFPVFQPNYVPPNHALVVQTAPFDGQIVANVASEPTSAPDYLLPRTASPDNSLTLKPRRTLPQTIMAADLFSALEAPLVNPTHFFPTVPNATRIHVSGPLAEYPVDQGAALAKAQTATDPLHVRFAVEVNAQEGKIHWYEPLDPVEDTALAEELLHTLVFSIPNKAALISGEIEIVLHD